MAQSMAPNNALSVRAHKKLDVAIRREYRYGEMFAKAGFHDQDASIYTNVQQVQAKIKQLRAEQQAAEAHEVIEAIRAKAKEKHEAREAAKAARRATRRMAKIEAGTASSVVIYQQDPLVAYEADAAVLLIMDQFTNSSMRWFSLKEAVVWATGLTDLKAAMAVHGQFDPDGDSVEATPVLKLFALLLRAKGLFIGKRTNIGGRVNSPVWRNEAMQAQHLRKRLSISAGPTLGGIRTKFDLDHKLTFGNEAALPF